MLEELEVFGLLAELSITLAGFAAVTATFAGRERAYRPTERIRLITLFTHAGIVLLGSGLVYTFVMYGFEVTLVYRVVSFCVALYFVAISIPMLVNAYKEAQKDNSSTENWALYIGYGLVLVMGSLLGWNVWLGTAAVLSGVFWLQLVYGLWIFSRLLMRAN